MLWGGDQAKFQDLGCSPKDPVPSAAFDFGLILFMNSGCLCNGVQQHSVSSSVSSPTIFSKLTNWISTVPSNFYPLHTADFGLVTNSIFQADQLDIHCSFKFLSLAYSWFPFCHQQYFPSWRTGYPLFLQISIPCIPLIPVLSPTVFSKLTNWISTVPSNFYPLHKGDKFSCLVLRIFVLSTTKLSL